MKQTENSTNIFKLKALSLLEVLITLVIIGILALIALPSLMPMITKAKSVEAQTQLAHLHKLQQVYRYTHSKYSTELKSIGFEQAKLTTQGGNANYLISIEKANTTQYVAKATAQVDFDGDGQFNVWVINHDNELKELVED
ncbi:MAG: prepilin-type N-terminal cleavage/methylation domain-containing protein [Flavobacteriales bacterium]|jgi:type IV pilus assembly protein PilE|nr:prepilin-type N-terminal cleavage/methylation domain-containing protein [Flavobacteriales bacterium]